MYLRSALALKKIRKHRETSAPTKDIQIIQSQHVGPFHRQVDVSVWYSEDQGDLSLSKSSAVVPDRLHALKVTNGNVTRAYDFILCRVFVVIPEDLRGVM